MPFSGLPQGNGGDPGWLAFVLIGLMAIWGGCVNYFSRLRKSAGSFSWRELFIELMISAFAAIVVGLFAFAFNVHWLFVLGLAGIAGHAGCRTVMLLDKLWGEKLKSFTKRE